MQRELGQLGLADAVVDRLGQGRGARELERIEGLLDWGRVKSVLSSIYASPTGRPSWPLETLLKVMLLQQWYGLSDPQMEEALSDRLSFRRFAGLGLGDGTPDHSTISRFRQQLAGVGQEVFREVSCQLEHHGLVVKQGTLIDASLVASAAQEPPKQKGGGERPYDPEAKWTKRGNKAYFGYKIHVAVDQGSGLVRGVEVTSAPVSDCVFGPSLVQGDEQAVFADMGYDSQTLRAHLESRGITNQVMRRPNRKVRVLPPEDLARNKSISQVRGRVETVFAILKRHYRLARMRYFGLKRNTIHVILAVTAMNLRRSLRLLPA